MIVLVFMEVCVSDVCVVWLWLSTGDAVGG